MCPPENAGDAEGTGGVLFRGEGAFPFQRTLKPFHEAFGGPGYLSLSPDMTDEARNERLTCLLQARMVSGTGGGILQCLPTSQQEERRRRLEASRS